MGDLIQKLEEIKQLPLELHLFCPRQNDADFDRYEKTKLASNDGGQQSVDRQPVDQEMLRRIREAEERRSKFMDAMGLIAFDGVDTESYKEYIWERLNEGLSKCDLCIPAYYLAKIDMRESLQQQFEEEEVKSFFDIIDKVDMERIVKGLDQAARTLLGVPQQKRNLSCLDQASLFSIFEALSCEALLRNESLLQHHFDEPFKLIQEKKALRTRDYVPAATRFLFDAEVHRFKWASTAWTRYDRPPSETEWAWTVREALQKRFTQVYEERSPSSVWRLWNGLRFIVGRLDQQQITHNLREIEPDVSRMALEHLSVKTPGLNFILQTVKLLLRKAPSDFWDAMGSIPPSTVVEQIFSSPFYEELLQSQSATAFEAESSAGHTLSWIPLFVSSLKPANQPPACRALAAQLFGRAKNLNLTEQARMSCRRAALKMLLQLLQQFIYLPELRRSVGRVILCETLDIVSQHVQSILWVDQAACSSANEVEDVELLSMDAIRNSLDLECQMLKDEHLALSGDKSLQRGSSTFTPVIWTAVLERLHTNDTRYTEATLCGTLALPGLERFINRRSKAPPNESIHYNENYEKITDGMKLVLEKIADFAPEHLDHLFKTQETSMPLIAALFSDNQQIYMAAVELIKNVSGQPGQKEALAHLLRAFPGTSLYSLSWAFRRVACLKTFASVPRMLKIGMDILEILTDTHTGLLRDGQLEPRDLHAARSYWTHQWQALKTVFQETERWHSLYYDKEMMTEVCRDAMQYAEALFEQYDVFASATGSSESETGKSIDKSLLENVNGSPSSASQAMSRWLRLRDEYLSATLVTLITKMLRRLSDHDVKVPANGLGFIEEVAVKHTVKTMLSAQQKAEIIRALEIYLKRPIAVGEPLKRQKHVTDWTQRLAKNDSMGSHASGSRQRSVDESGGSDVNHRDVHKLSKSIEQSKVSLSGHSRVPQRAISALPKPAVAKVKKQSEQKSPHEISAFLENRRKENDARKARDRQVAAQLRGKNGVGGQTKAGALGQIGGDKASDRTALAESMMVSSDTESDSENEMERQLFGSTVETVKQNSASVFPEAAKTATRRHQVPVKKAKRLLHRNDMRARLAPDLSSLHLTMLSWEFFADSGLPPNSVQKDYTMVTKTFSTVSEYQTTFEPLLLLEGWQSFRSAREEGNFKPFEIKVSNRLTVDDAVEINVIMSVAVVRELGLGPADVVLLSRDPKPHGAPSAPHCLARLKERNLKQGQMEVVLRVNVAHNPLLSMITRDSSLWGVQLLSLTPLEREYGALKALAFYDLAEEIIQAAPSSILEYTDQQLQPLVQNYRINQAQAKAVRSALDNDAFTLIQGPPGSGKTKTICAMVGAMITESLRNQASAFSRAPAPASGSSAPSGALPAASKKLLICAPSNAAVDELVMRLKNGIKTLDGQTEKLSIVRLGRSDAINANIKDVTLEELVNAKLNSAMPKQGRDRDIHEIMQEHKETSDQLHTLRTQMDQRRARGEAVPQADAQSFEGLKNKKGQLSLQIDKARERQKTASRDVELERRRIQQCILDSAHVLCATLSGSGHEVFQNLNIEFETVIIDEAAQSIELSALIPLKYGCSKCILVGDPKQLPPTVLSREAARFQYEQSLFARMEQNHPGDVHLLDTQYRMHPEISLFPSKTFYEGRLQDGADMAKLRARPWHHSSLLAPYRFFDVKGMQSASSKGRSLVNIAELDVALQLYDRLVTDCKQYDFSGKIGIITPYRGQLKELRTRFSRRYGESILSRVEFNTTDAFQGRESEIVIFSCVRATPRGIGFLSDIRRMNVGLTRAKSSLWVLGDSNTLSQGEFWRGLIMDAKARNLHTDGDVSRLLERPLLTVDMMREDVEMEGADAQGSTIRRTSPDPQPTHEQARSDPHRHSSMSSPISSNELTKPAAMSRSVLDQQAEKRPSLESSVHSASGSGKATGASGEAAGSLSLPVFGHQQASRRGANGPSGGRSGLNDLAKCRVCGSESHFSHACENSAARSAAHGQCLRCHSSLHPTYDCSEVRCVECGEIGHGQSACQAPPESVLGPAEKGRVQRQEQDLVREKARAQQRRGEKQLGHHDAKIPTVRSSVPDPGPRPSSTLPDGPVNSAAADAKRKRDSVASGVDASRGTKAMRPDQGVDLTHDDPRPRPNHPIPPQQHGMGFRPPTGPKAGPDSANAGVHIRRKAKDSDVFLKRK